MWIEISENYSALMLYMKRGYNLQSNYFSYPLKNILVTI